MAGPKFATVNEYLEAQPVRAREALVLVRDAIHEALPGAEDAISYGMPACRVKGRAIVYYAAWKAHYSIYPAPAGLASLGPEAAALKVSKGTLRFPYDEPVPSQLIARIARLMAKEDAARGR